jgi:hypothetical protein
MTQTIQTGRATNNLIPEQPGFGPIPPHAAAIRYVFHDRPAYSRVARNITHDSSVRPCPPTPSQFAVHLNTAIRRQAFSRGPLSLRTRLHTYF